MIISIPTIIVALITYVIVMVLFFLLSGRSRWTLFMAILVIIFDVVLVVALFSFKQVIPADSYIYRETKSGNQVFYVEKSSISFINRYKFLYPISKDNPETFKRKYAIQVDERKLVEIDTTVSYWIYENTDLETLVGYLDNSDVPVKDSNSWKETIIEATQQELQRQVDLPYYYTFNEPEIRKIFQEMQKNVSEKLGINIEITIENIREEVTDNGN